MSEFKLPLKVKGVAFEAGRWKGQSGKYIIYQNDVVLKAVEMLTGVQIRLNHNEDDENEINLY